MIAVRKNGTAIEGVTDEERQHVYISLYQTHLPKPKSVGLVNYNKEERSVEFVPSVAERGFFWVQSGVSESWNRYYALLGTLSWALVLSLWVGLSGFALVSWSAVAASISAALLVLVLTHYLSKRNGGTLADTFEAFVE